MRIVEQMIDVTEISDVGSQVWQRAVAQFLDDTKQEPISRISASTRELKRIVSLFEIVKEKMYSEMLGAGVVKRRSLKRLKGFSANPGSTTFLCTVSEGRKEAGPPFE